MKRRRDNEASGDEVAAEGAPDGALATDEAPPAPTAATAATEADEDDEDDGGPRRWEAWAAEKGTPTWLLAAAKTCGGWAIGFVVDEATFDATVRAAGAVQMSAPRVRRGGPYGPRKVS